MVYHDFGIPVAHYMKVLQLDVHLCQILMPVMMMMMMTMIIIIHVIMSQSKTEVTNQTQPAVSLWNSLP